MELVGTATMSFLRWPGEHGRMYSLGGEGTQRISRLRDQPVLRDTPPGPAAGVGTRGP
jgi:hypothetical protein